MADKPRTKSGDSVAVKTYEATLQAIAEESAARSKRIRERMAKAKRKSSSKPPPSSGRPTS